MVFTVLSEAAGGAQPARAAPAEAGIFAERRQGEARSGVDLFRALRWLAASESATMFACKELP